MTPTRRSLPAWRRAFRCGSVGLWPIAALIVGCAGEEAREPAVPMRRVSSVAPLGWRADGKQLLFRRADQLAAGDAGTAACDSTGLYIFTEGQGISPWKIGPEVCNELWDGRDVELGHDERALLYSEVYAERGIFRFDLGDGAKVKLVDSCLPNQNRPTWSPNGAVIAVSANCDIPERPFLHLVNADGSELRPVARADSLPETEPSWAPGGGRIAVTSGRGEVNGLIVIVDTTTGRRETLTRGYSPAWSPTGEWIAYLRKDSTPDTTASIRMVRPDGTGDRVLFESASPRLTVGELVLGPLRWSPDGSALAFGRGKSIWVAHLDGSAAQSIVSVVDQPADDTRGGTAR